MTLALPQLDYKHPATWIATWFGCGLARPAPGTWGTLGGLPFGILILQFGGWHALLIAAAAAFIAGLWASAKVEKMSGAHDPSYIVIDEVAGIWVTLLAAPATLPYVGLAFLLFRAFDVVKPWPVSWCDEKLPGAWGVMTDDIVAGIMAGVCIGGIRYAGLG
jgi:phosphatidylglycerophosphatase A